MTDRTDIDMGKLRQTLEKREAELLHLTEVSEESRKPVELDQTRVGRLSRMDALQAQAMAKETGQRRKQELQRIKAALERMEEDEYGYCVRCGEEIAAKRLELDPSVALCIRCANG